MLNAIKAAIYKELISVFPEANVFYNIAPQNATGYKIIYDFATAVDNDTLKSNRLESTIQVAVYYPSKSQQQATSKEADECLKLAYNVLKLKNINHTYDGHTVKTNTLLPELVTPARFRPDNKEWLAIVRFRAIFEYDDFTAIPVTGVTIDPTTLELQENKTHQLSFKIAPANATNQAVTWTSSDESIVTVDANGLIQAHAEGVADVTVTTVDGGFVEACAVTAIPPIIATEIEPNFTMFISSNIGAEIQINMDCTPADATVSYQYSSNNEANAEVDSNGLITVTGTGQAVITIKEQYSAKKTIITKSAKV